MLSLYCGRSNLPVSQRDLQGNKLNETHVSYRIQRLNKLSRNTGSNSEPGAESINAQFASLYLYPFPSIQHSKISRGPSPQPGIVLMLLLSGFQRRSFIKLCKRTPLAPSLSSKMLPKVQLNHWLSVERPSLSVLKLLSWSCHIHVILTLCLPPPYYISLLSRPSYLHFSSLGRAHLCVAFMWSTSHWHLNCWAESPGNFRAWMSFHFYSYLQNKGGKLSPLTVFRLLHQMHPECLDVEPHTLPIAPKSQVLAKSVIPLLPLT